MIKKAIILTFILLAVPSALALPRGLSGIGSGFGLFVGAEGAAPFIQGEFDFQISPYVAIGPELGAVFGEGTTLLTGGEARVYVIPHYDIIT